MVDAPLAPSAEEPAAVPHPLLGYALVVGAVVLWSANAVVAKVVLGSGELSALRLSEVRGAGAGLIMFVALLVLRPASLRLAPGEWLPLALFGICGLAVVQFLYFAAIERLDIGTALVIEYTAPILVAAWARLFGHEQMRWRLWVALGLSLAGLVFVVELPSGVRLSGVGVIAALGGAFAYAFYILAADRRLKAGRDTPSLLAWGFLFAALFWSVVQPWWSFPGEAVTRDASLLGRLEDLSAPVWLLLAFVVVLGTIVPFIMVITALHHLSPTRVIVVAMVEPVIAALAAFAWLGEELSGPQIGGGLVVLGAVALAQTARPHPPDV